MGRERAGDLQWSVTAKVDGELYRLLVDLAADRGLEVGELVTYLVAKGVEGMGPRERNLWHRDKRATIRFTD